MRGHLADLAARREALVARSRSQREDLGGRVQAIRARVSWVGTLLGAARGLARSGPLLAVATGVLVVAGPSFVLRAVSKAARYAPIALDAYRVARGLGERRPDRPAS